MNSQHVIPNIHVKRLLLAELPVRNPKADLNGVVTTNVRTRVL